MSGTRKEVAESIMALTYIEMMEMATSMVESTKSSKEDNEIIDFENPNYVADRLRWWAEGHLDFLKDTKDED